MQVPGRLTRFLRRGSLPRAQPNTFSYPSRREWGSHNTGRRKAQGKKQSRLGRVDATPHPPLFRLFTGNLQRRSFNQSSSRELLQSGGPTGRQPNSQKDILEDPSV